MQRIELFSAALGAAAFALTFHTESDLLRLIFPLVALAATLRVQQSSNVLWTWLLGTGAMLGCYYWLADVGPSYFGINQHWGLVIWISFAAFEGSIFLFAHLLSRALKKALPSAATAISWTIVELLFPHIIPWSWANLFLSYKPIVLSVGTLGAPMFSLLLFLAAGPVIARTSASTKISAVALSLLLLTSVLQLHELRERTARAKTIRIGVVQSNLDPAADFRPEKRFENVARQRLLSETILHENPELLVWPESAVHFDYPESLQRVPLSSPGHPFPALNIPILFGTQTLLAGANETGIPRYHLSGLMLGSDGAVLGRYDKRRLLPFAETMPMTSSFPSLKTVLPSGYELVPGVGPRSIPLPAPHDGVVEVSICYEDLFSSAFEPIENPSVLITLSNDVWFQTTAASRQHHLLSRLRAIEQGKYFVRVSTNGVTGLVSPSGEELFHLPLFKAGAAVVEVPLL